MATRNPARVGRVAGRQRGLAPGERADIVEFDFDEQAKSIRVLRTWLDGELVFEAN
jgi:predicted amidohydrolase YtcJ